MSYRVELPETVARAYTEEALDVRNTVTEKMGRMTPTQFEGLRAPRSRPTSGSW